jgi:hypothetical protein
MGMGGAKRCGLPLSASAVPREEKASRAIPARALGMIFAVYKVYVKEDFHL